MKSNYILLTTIYLLILTLTPVLFAQEDELQRANELNEQVIQLYQQGQYEMAIPIAQQALRLREHASGPNHPDYPDVAASLSNIIGLWGSMGNGIATALEIAGLDLAETDLVTLSACVTGIGDLKSSEGLYGLHRSFLLAGAKTVLASLWSVPDLETKDLMVEFYRLYLLDSKMRKTEALRQAQLAVIKNLRDKYDAAPPAYWGAFVCIGEP